MWCIAWSSKGDICGLQLAGRAAMYRTSWRDAIGSFRIFERRAKQRKCVSKPCLALLTFEATLLEVTIMYDSNLFRQNLFLIGGKSVNRGRSCNLQ